MLKVEHSRFQQERQTPASKDNKQIIDKESSKTTKRDYHSQITQITQYPTEDAIQDLISHQKKLSQTDDKANNLKTASKITTLLEQEYKAEELEQHIKGEQQSPHLVELKRYRRSDSSDEDNQQLKETQKQLNNAKLFVAIREKKSEQEIINNIKKLLKHADINAKNNNNKTLLQIAIEKRYVEVVKFLLQNNAIITEDLKKLIEEKIEANPDINEFAEIKNLLENPPAQENNNSLIKSNNNIEQSKRQGKAQGESFEKNLAVWFLVQQYKNKLQNTDYSFTLFPEFDDTQKLDDIVIRYKKATQEKLIFVQAKHKVKTTNISDKALLALKGDESLLMYCNAYLKAKDNPELRKKVGLQNQNNEQFRDLVEDFILATNNKLDSKYFSEMKNDQKLNIGARKLYGIDTDQLDVLLQKLKEIFQQTNLNSEEQKNKDELAELSKLTDDQLEHGIREFLSKLVFATELPSENNVENLEKITKEEILNNVKINGESLQETEIDDYFNALAQLVLRKKGETDTSIPGTELDELFSAQKQKLYQLLIDKIHAEKLENLRVEFNKKSLAELDDKLQNFFLEEKKILNIIIKEDEDKVRSFLTNKNFIETQDLETLVIQPTTQKQNTKNRNKYNITIFTQGQNNLYLALIKGDAAHNKERTALTENLARILNRNNLNFKTIFISSNNILANDRLKNHPLHKFFSNANGNSIYDSVEAQNQNDLENKLNDFVTPKKQIFNLISSDSINLSYTKLDQVLHEKQIKDLIFIDLQSLLKNQQKFLPILSQKSTLIIEYNISSEKENEFKTLFDQLLSPHKRIIFLTKQKEIIQNLLLNPDLQAEYYEIKNNFGDFTQKVQEDLLKKDVIIFQEQKEKTNLAQFIRIDDDNLNNYLSQNKNQDKMNDIIDSETLTKLITGKEIKIGNELKDLGEIKNYYIPRLFNQQWIFNKEKIIKDIKDKKILDFFIISGANSGLTSSDNRIYVFDENNHELAQSKFQELCKQKPGFNIHWLRSKSERLIWKKSHGSIVDLMKYKEVGKVDRNDRKTSKKENDLIEKLVNQKDRHKIMILSDTPGMGKSTVLTSLSLNIKVTNPNLWVIRIDLKTYTKALDDESKKRGSKKPSFNQEDVKSAVEFLLNLLESQEQSKFTTNLEKNLFKNNLINGQGEIVLLFDGFDEISPDYKEIVIDLLQALKKSKTKKLFIATRPNMREVLEEKLEVFAYTLEPFLRKNQKDFLTKFWKENLGSSSSQDGKEARLDKYVETLLDKFSNSINDFVGIPLQLAMIAKVFQQNTESTQEEWQRCKDFLDNNNEEPKLPKKFDLLSLYEGFVKEKFYDVYLKDKKERDFSKPGEWALADENYKNFKGRHETLALYGLLSDEDFKKVVPKERKQEIDDWIQDITSAKKNEGFIDQIINNKPHFVHFTFAEYFASFPLVKQFIQDSTIEFQYIDNVIGSTSPVFINSIIKQLDKKQTEIVGLLEGKTLLNLAAQKGFLNCVKALLEANYDNYPKPDSLDKTPLHYAAEYGHSDIVEYLIKSNNDILEDNILEHGAFKKEEYADSKLVTFVNKKDNTGNTAVYYAAKQDKMEIACDLLLKGADIDSLKEYINPVTLYVIKKTHGTYANQYHKLRPIEEKLLLQAPGSVSHFNEQYEYPRLLSYFFVHGRVKVIEALLSSINDEEKKKRLLNAEDNGYTPLDRVNLSENLNDKSRLAITKYLLKNGGIETKQDVGLSFENTNSKKHYITKILQAAAQHGHIRTFDYFINKENQKLYYLHLYQAAQSQQFNIIKYLLENHRKNIRHNGNTALHSAVDSGSSLKIIKYFIDNGEDINAQNDKGETPLFQAIYANRRLNVIKHLVENYQADVNIKDKNGNIALYYAITNDQQDTIKYLVLERQADISLISDKLIRNKAEFFISPNRFDLNSVDQDGMPLLHKAIRSNDLEWSKFLIRQGANINNKDIQGRTSLHWASERQQIDIVELLLQYGAIFNAKDHEHHTPRDLLSQLSSSNEKIIWLLDVLERLFNSQNLMQDLNEQLLEKGSDILKDWGPYGSDHPDAWDGNNPMLFILNARNVEEKTLLHIAADTNDEQTIDILLKFNKDYLARQAESRRFPRYKDYQSTSIDAIDIQGNTPMHLAAQKGYDEIVHLLLNNGAIFNAENNQGQTPEELAKNGKHDNVIKLLQTTKSLFDAIEQNSLVEVKNYINEGAYINAKDKNGKTPLHFAASSGQKDIVQLLLNKGAYVEVIDVDGRTPLHFTAINDQVEIIKLLLKNGASFNAKDKQNKAPFELENNQSVNLLDAINKLFSYIQSDDPDLSIEYLKTIQKDYNIDIGTIINSRDNEGNTILHYAAESGYYDIVQFLLRNGAIFDAKNKLDHAPAQLELLDSIKEMFGNVDNVLPKAEKVNVQIIINVRNDQGETLLHKATEYGNLKVVKWLLRQEVDVNAEDNNGRTALHLAAEYDSLEVVKLLIKYGADVNAKDKNDQTALDLADDEKIVELLQQANTDLAITRKKTTDNQAQRHNSQNRNTDSRSNSQGSQAESIEPLEREKFTDHIEHSVVDQNTLEAATQNSNYRYWLSDQDIRRIAHLDNTYRNMFDVHAMDQSNSYETSGRGLVVVTDYNHEMNQELGQQIHKFIEIVNENRITQQQRIPRRTFIINQGGNHWASLVVAHQNGQYHVYYVDSLGIQMPQNIHTALEDNGIINFVDFHIVQQADGHNCGLWALENARDINTMLQENKDIVWLQAELAPQRGDRNNAQYFIDRRREFSQILRENEEQIDAYQNRNTASTSNSQESRAKSLESLEEARNEAGLSRSNCAARSSSIKRRKRDICTEDEVDDLFPYDPLEETVEQSIETNARLYSNIAYLFSVQNLDDSSSNIRSENVINYNRNLGDIISEGQINHSKREEKLLKKHYEEATKFISRYNKDRLLNLVEEGVNLADSDWLFDNGRHSLLVSYEGNHYRIYSQDYNYRVVFQSKEEVSFSKIEEFARAFFRWRSGSSSEYKIFTLAKNLPQTVVEKLKQAKFWSPDEVASDLMLLNKGSFSHIENIPARVIRELFFLDGQVPEITTLNEDFFRQYLGRISLKVEEIHNVLPILVEQESKDLVNLINRYNFPIDKNYLNTLPESSREILHAYHNKVTDKLQQLSNTDPITIQDLSDLSWKIVEDKMQEDPDISPELKESAIKNVKDLHKSASNRMHALGVTTQTLFFLPDIIRSVNNDDYQQLAKLGGMIGGDMAFNKLYESLINKLEPVLASSRISLLKKLPITSPIFKVLTIHSIIELTNELNTLPADSERRSIIKHQLGEQYFTVGLMVAEMFGFELGPLCIGLMAEQLIYSAISLRKQYHLDISFGEALLLSLGFEKQKLQSMLEERGLVDINLSIINTLSNQTQTNYDFAIVKVPKVIDEVPKAENAVVEFKPYSHYSCMEDNVFLEESSGYKRVVSVVDNDSRNCAAKSPLRISGSGLAAFYSNKKLSNATRNIINIFDPNEGDLELKFTVEGLQELDRLNQLDQTSAYNKTAAYIVTTKILHKPYPDQIGLFGNKNHSLVLNDNSKRIISKYYIDGTIPFKLKDNIVSTSLMFLNNKVFNGYNAYISGDTQNIYVDSIYPGNRITGNIIFKDKNYLNLNLNSTLIKKLELNIPYVDLRYARGKSSREAGIIVVKPGLLVSNMSLGPNIRLLVDGSNEENNNRIIIRTHSISQSSLVLLQISLNEYKSYYSFSIDELQLILDDLNQMSRLFPRKFYFNCVQQPMSPRELCELSNSDISKNIILMIGKINDVDAKLTIEYQSSTLEALNGKVKHIEVMHYNNRVVLANNLLNFKKVVKPSEYNISHYHNNIVKHRSLPNWLMLKFSSNVQDDLLHHFKYDNVNNKVNINGINYLVQDNRIYAALDDEIDGSKLVRFDEKRTISVFVDRSLTNSTISTISTTSLQEKAVNINNATLYNLPDKTMIIFQESENKSLSVSFKLLLDSLVEKELPKQEVESVEFESTAQLKHVVSQQLKQLDSEIINGLKYLLANIGIKHNVKTYQCLGFYSLVAQKEFINAHNNDYNNQHLNQILSHDQVIETLIWLIAHSYSDYLSRNPNSKRSKLIKNIHQCFRFIVDKKIIHRLVKQLEKEDIEFRVKRFIKHHKQALKDRLEEKVQKYLGSEYLNVDASYSNSYSNNYQYSHHYIPQPEALISSATQQSSWMNDLINSGISKVKNLSTSLINRLFTDNASANNQSEHHSTFSQHHHSGYDQVPPNDNMTLLAMGDYYISRVDLNGTISLLDVIVRKLTGEKRSLFRDATISELEATNYAINITQELKKLVKQAAKDSFISEHRLNIDFIAMQEKITRKIMGGRFFEIEKILSSHIEQVCPSRKSGYSGRLSLKKFNKFMTIFYDKLEVILNQSMLQMLYSQDSMSMAYSKESNIIAEKRNLNIDSTDIEFIRVKTNNLHERPHNDLQPSLRGANLIPSTDIGSINAYFGEYTLNASENILELRVNDVGLKNVSIARNCVFEEHYNNLQRMIDDLIDTKSKIILAPVNLYNKHAVGIIALKNQDNELKLYYIDPSNEAMPDKLKQIFIDNSLQIEQLPVEQQKYANCGPEVVENFILYLTGERLLQEESIIYHSELVEQELVSKANNLTEIMSDCTNDQESVQDLHELNGQEEVELDSEDVVYIDIDEESDSSLEYPAPISRTTKDTKLLEKDKDLNNNNNSINDDLIREKKALFAYNQGNIFSNQAWEAENDENDDRSVEAAENFAKSLKFYQEAVKLSPNNIVYKHSLDITSLKIEGNSLFSEGVELANIAYELQEEANELVIDQEAYQEVLSHYQQAIGAYQLAKDSFFKGWLLSWDTRFESCIEIVKNSIVSVQEAIEEIEEKIDGKLIQKPTDITVADNYLVNDPIELFKQDDQPNLLNNYLAGNIVQEIYYM